MEFSKGLEFRGDSAELEKCVSRTGLDGSWKKLPNGHRQFITDNGGILNWSRYTGSIWFQGERSAAKEFKREFKAAAKGRIEWKCLSTRKSPEEKVVGSSHTRKSLKRISKHLKIVEEDLDEEFARIVEKLDRLEEWLGHLLNHVGVPDWSEIAIVKKKKKRRIVAMQHTEAPIQNERCNVIDAGQETPRKAQIDD